MVRFLWKAKHGSGRLALIQPTGKSNQKVANGCSGCLTFWLVKQGGGGESGKTLRSRAPVFARHYLPRFYREDNFSNLGDKTLFDKLAIFRNFTKYMTSVIYKFLKALQHI